MRNHNAVKINERLGVQLFNEYEVKRLKLNHFTKKQIKDLCIDDLVDATTRQGTDRLAGLVKEILFGEA